MGQAQATGENRAIEAVNDALDSPLLNDNDITGAEQVLLKIVSGVGEDEIKMSELSKIKNKIQQAAGRDVNIIEGIGFDEDLGSAVSVTVIATGFETKKVNEPVTIKLEDSDLEIEDEIENIDTQQKLLLDEESIEFENHIIQENLLSSESETIKTDISLENDNEIIEKPEEIISDFLEENIEEETSISNSIDENEEDLIEFESQSKNTISEEVNISNDQSMKIEAREREERLREISIKLRTPSGLTKLEDEPAYKRNNINLEEGAHSSQDEVSHFSLSDKDDDIILNDNNSYLHDNVD
jgi:cell division protein FtsZ